MRRFYEAAGSAPRPDGDGHAILLDGRPVRTPARADLAVPGAALAAALVSEWNAQGEKVAPATMPITGFANATIDTVLPDVAGFAATICGYAATDLFCYRADGPDPLVARQSEAWDAPLAWARHRYDVHFEVTAGIMPVDQPAATVERLSAAVAALDPWLLAGLSVIVSITGTLVGALALLDGEMDADALWSAATLDEAWQTETWGEDAEATARLAARRADFDDAVRYCTLVAIA